LLLLLLLLLLLQGRKVACLVELFECAGGLTLALSNTSAAPAHRARGLSGSRLGCGEP